MAAGWSPHYPWSYPPQSLWEASSDQGAEAASRSNASRSDGPILSGPKVEEYLANYDGKKAKAHAQHHPHHAFAHQAHQTHQWYAAAAAAHAAAAHGHNRGAHPTMNRGHGAELHGGVAGGADQTAVEGNSQSILHFRPPPPREYQVEEPPEDDEQHHEVEEEVPQLVQFHPADGRLSPQPPMPSTPQGITQIGEGAESLTQLAPPPAAPPPPGDGLGDMHMAQ